MLVGCASSDDTADSDAGDPDACSILGRCGQGDLSYLYACYGAALPPEGCGAPVVTQCNAAPPRGVYCCVDEAGVTQPWSCVP
jgi:hypothetical protein